ncbi:MAG: ABC transporter ATP-binding protein [Luteimonas sp.]
MDTTSAHHDELSPATGASVPAAAPLATLQAARKHYGGVTALDGADLAVHAGEVVSLLGANGAGKTTAIGLLLGLLQPDGGTAELFGRQPGALDARRQTGVMLQDGGVQDDLRVQELLQLTRSYYPHPRSIADCMALAGLDGLLQRRYDKLSGGQQRRVQFVLAMCGRPRLLFLDEPTTGLDIQARQQLWAAVRALVAEGCGVLLTTHYLEEAEALSDRVVVLDRGRVAAEGSVSQIRAHVAQRRIRCVSVLDPALVTDWPQVRRATREGDRLEIQADASEAVVRRLLDADPSLKDLEVLRAGLADAFIQITREEEEAA